MVCFIDFLMAKEVNRFPWIRYCRLRIVSGCLKSFRARFRRQQACTACVDRLRVIGLSIWRYKKMAENKREETIELLKDGKFKMVSVEVNPVKNGTEVVGSKKEEWEFVTTRKDLEVGLENKLVCYRKVEDELDRLQDQIEAFGDIEMTAELEKLQKDILLIGRLEDLKKLKAQVPLKEAEFKAEQEFKSMREATLAKLDELEKEKD